MTMFSYFNIQNKKLSKARNLGLIFCFLLALFSAMILSFYHSTYILFQFYLGYTLLKLSIFFSVGFIICAASFDRILKDI